MVRSFMQAMRHGSAAARATMPRILNLFSFQDAAGAVSAAIRKAGRQVNPLTLHRNPNITLPLKLYTLK